MQTLVLEALKSRKLNARKEFIVVKEVSRYTNAL